jgi:hypothetical protein
MTQVQKFSRREVLRPNALQKQHNVGPVAVDGAT